jgi:Putative peptidoglycan binding domain
MRTLFVLTCCLTLAAFAGAAEQQQENPQSKKKGQPTQAVVKPHTQAVVKPHTQAVVKPHTQAVVKPHTQAVVEPHTQAVVKPHTQAVVKPHAQVGGGAQLQPHHNVQTQHNLSTAPLRTTTQGQTKAQSFHPQHFNLANKPNPSIPNVTFRANNHIQGSEHWQGRNYAAFRSYSSQWHDRGWWQGHHNRIVFVFGGPYYWDAGYWYPAWGYAPNAYYAYDGPIYAGNADMDPGQVVANVQSTLQAQGYYTGEVDGILGPLTRAAIAKYQQDHGLVITSAIDEPTLASLGMA